VTPTPIPSPTPRPTPTSTPSPTPSPSATSDEAALRAKIAGLLVVGFPGTHVSSSDWVVRALSEQGLGGVLLFGDNIVSRAQASALVRALRRAAGRPLVVAIDQEGGRVARLNPANGFPATSTAAAIGAADDPALARSWGQTLASSVAAIGANLNLAPVVDLDINPRNPAIGAYGRSFSADPDVVVAMATEELRAHRAAGVRTSLKHYPGLGSATGNTDLGVVDVSSTWQPAELDPYRRLIPTGLVDSVMVGTMVDRRLGSSRPAALSPTIVTRVLRGELGWQGPVVTDDMQGKAITRRYTSTEAITLAMASGVDVLLYGHQPVRDPGLVDHVVDTVMGLVRSGQVSEDHIDASSARVERLRS